MSGHQGVVDAAKASPAIAVSFLELGGVDVSTVALWLTAIYTSLLISHHIWSKWWVPIRNERRRQARRRRGVP